MTFYVLANHLIRELIHKRFHVQKLSVLRNINSEADVVRLYLVLGDQQFDDEEIETTQ
jgi:hypothetical protein